MKFEDIQPHVFVQGIVPNAAVTVVSVQWFGSDVLELTYKDAAGRVGQELLYRSDEPRLDIVERGRPWSFDGDGTLFRLVSEAHRIRLAYLFDPLVAVHTSRVEPLPHQIAAVYETMLPRQPLRFLLADDPGAGKTIMAGLLIKELLVRGDVQRCLIVCPGNLVEQWQDELSQRFQLPFEILYGDLFTPRQIVALTTFSDLVGEAVGVYLAFAIDRMAMTGNSLVRWNAVGEKAQHCFGRQALPMLWDFAEPNFLASATGSVEAAVFYSCDPLNWMEPPASGASNQEDAATQQTSSDKIVSTDPPYYDNIGYADLSDFFYVWLRRSLRPVFPDLFATLAVPKAEELVATPYRHGSKEKAEQFFLDGMTQPLQRLAEQVHPAFPVTIYYAFKQQETENRTEDVGLSENSAAKSSVLSHKSYPLTTTSTGWETFFEAVIRAGFAISGTWPMRTELSNRMIGSGTNALASSIVLVCRPRPADAPTVTRRELLQALKAELPAALAELQKANITPVDLAQAAIGPGMAVYSRYAKVLDAEGQPVSVREALALINATLDEALAEQESDFDADTRWVIAWFDQYGFAEGEYGAAETLATAKNTSVSGLAEAGLLESKRGKVRLFGPNELPADWDPERDRRLTAWEVAHHLIRVLEAGGESGAPTLVGKLGAKAETARELAYRLYTLCERKKRAAEALLYNALVQSWPEIVRLARESGIPHAAQATLFGGDEV